jgi:hypothetical protein
MDCPLCHAENVSAAAACATCGRSLGAKAASGSGERRSRRSGSRRRHNENAWTAALDSDNPAAHRAYRLSVWSIVPGFGLVLGPLAMILGCQAASDAGDDLSARNRAKAAVLFGAGSTFTQWLGVMLIYYGWGV